MIIELPNKFKMTSSNNTRNIAIVLNGQLKIYGYVSFKRLMYKLTYALKGKHECFYCKTYDQSRKMTLDHLYPQDLGGITVTNNMVPACQSCNIEKSNFTFGQYNNYKTLNSKKRKEYRISTQRKVRWIKKNKGTILPADWYSYCSIDSIYYNENHEIDTFDKYEKVEANYKKYKKIITPIIVDKNRKILDGQHAYLFAVDNAIDLVPVVILENVELIKSAV